MSLCDRWLFNWPPSHLGPRRLFAKLKCQVDWRFAFVLVQRRRSPFVFSCGSSIKLTTFSTINSCPSVPRFNLICSRLLRAFTVATACLQRPRPVCVHYRAHYSDARTDCARIWCCTFQLCCSVLYTVPLKMSGN